MGKINFILNDESISAEINPGMVLLDFIRKNKNLTGTKESCREGDCGACAVLLGELSGSNIKYKIVNSCIFPIGNADKKHVVTIEGINTDSLSPIQKYFIEEGASQCGFCTPGFIISLTCYLLNNIKLNYENAINVIAGNICRCTGYSSIKRAVNSLINNVTFGSVNNNNHLQTLTELNFIPEYFLKIDSKLRKLVSAETKIEPDNMKSGNIIGGGTDLYVQKPEEQLEQSLYFINKSGKHLIAAENDICTISGDVTFEEFRESAILQKRFNDLKYYLNLIASKPIRNSATIGGNIVNASPIGDMTIFLLALNAELVLTSGSASRRIMLKDFYEGYKKLNKKPYEKIESISFILPGNNSSFSFEKVSKRTYLDIASVNSAMFVQTKDNEIINAGITAGGVAPIPLLLAKSSKYLEGKRISADLLDELLAITDSEISPIDDIRGSAEYKRILLKQLIKAHFLKLFPETINIDVLL